MDPNLPYKSMLGSAYDAMAVQDELVSQAHPSAHAGFGNMYDGHIPMDQKGLRQSAAAGFGPQTGAYGHHPVMPSQYIPPGFNGLFNGSFQQMPLPYGQPGSYVGGERIVGEYREPPRLVAERAVEHQPVQMPVVTVEKTVEIPTVVVKEHPVQVPKVELVERVIEMPKIQYEEHIREVPQKQYVEKVVEVPQTQVEEKVIHVPVIVYQERVIEIPKIEYVEKIEYEDTVEYREVPVDTYVEVPEVEYRYKEVEVTVPEPYFQEVPQYKYTEVPMVQVQEVERIEQVPVPVHVAAPRPAPVQIPVQPVAQPRPVVQPGIQQQYVMQQPVMQQPMMQQQYTQPMMRQPMMQPMVSQPMQTGIQSGYMTNQHLSAGPWHAPGSTPTMGAPTPPFPR